MSQPVPDLVRISKLDTLLRPEYTQHTRYVSGTTSRQRRIRKEEQWKEVDRLGSGSYGIVCLQRCSHGDDKGQLRAVKKVQKLESSDYYRELEAIALFSHNKYEQCFVKSFGWYDDSDSIYITMEYLQYGDLHSYLNSPLPENEAKHIVFQILEGLVFMHQNGFTHRDLKPGNLLVVCKGPDWWVKIADFGISKRAMEGVTALRTVTGTPAFTAPEVLGFIQSCDQFDDSYTNAVDIWSLGVIAFLILTGETLFRDQRRLGQYVAGRFPFPAHTLSANNVSEQGCTFVKCLMAIQYEVRPKATESLQQPWLKDITFSAASEDQRQSFDADSAVIIPSRPKFEVSATWSNQDSNRTRKQQAPPRVLSDQAASEPSAKWSTHSPISDFDEDSSDRTPTETPNREPHVTLVAAATPGPDVKIQWKKSKMLSSHTSVVCAVAFSPDGKLVASVSMDNTVMLWDVATGTARSMLSGHTYGVFAVAFSPDGQLVASGSADNTVVLWDVATGTARSMLSGHKSSVEAVAFSPDGKLVASGSVDRTIRLWDVATGTARRTLSGHTGTVCALEFSPDSKIVASGSADETVGLWDGATRTARSTLSGHTGRVRALAFSPDGKMVASGSSVGAVKLWNIATKKEYRLLHGHRGPIRAIMFTPDGEIAVASVFVEETVTVWGNAIGEGYRTLRGHRSHISAVAFSPDGKLAASGSKDGKFMLWDVESAPFTENDETHQVSREVETHQDFREVETGHVAGKVKTGPVAKEVRTGRPSFLRKLFS